MEYVVGAMLSHVHFHDVATEPTTFDSRHVTISDRINAKIEKERLAIMLEKKKFYRYLYDHTFTVLIDHHPLEAIFDMKRATNFVAAVCTYT